MESNNTLGFHHILPNTAAHPLFPPQTLSLHSSNSTTKTPKFSLMTTPGSSSSGRKKHVASRARKISRTYDPNLPFEPNHILHEAMTTWLTKEKRVVSSIAPHMPTMENLGIYELINNMFTHSGMPNWFKAMSGETYNKLVIEFICSFAPITNDKGDCIAWSYMMNNHRYTTKKEDVRRAIFGEKDEGVIPNCTNEQRLFFWQIFTGMENYHPYCSPKSFFDGALKYIHRLIAININTRADEGPKVSKSDLDLLYLMWSCQKIDWFYVVTEKFKKMCDRTDSIKALGCTSIIRRLAEYEQMNLVHKPDDSRELTVTRLIGMRLMDPNTYDWIVEQTPKPRSADKGKRPMGDE